MDESKLWQQREARQNQLSVLRWLPIVGAAILLLMVAVVSTHVLTQLRNATIWRQHTIQVILAAQSFQDNLLDIQRGGRTYVTTGDANALASYENCAKLEPQLFNQLLELTHDNSSQQKRLEALAAAMQNLFSYHARMIGVYEQKGIDAVLKADVAGAENRTVFSNARDVLKAFSDDEENFLNVRDAAEQSYYHTAEELLLIGCVLAAVLIVFANFMANRELASRHRAEAKLNRALMLQKAILNSAEYAIVTTDPAGIVQTLNSAAERLLGYSAKELIGRETLMLWRDPQEVAERAANLSKRLGRPVKPTFDTVATKVQFEEIDDGEWTFIRKDSKRFMASLVVSALTDNTGNFTGFIGIFRDISARKSLEAEREKLIYELKDALAQVKSLSGLIPICGWCKSVRNDTGYWQSVEQYVRAHTDATFTHGMCPDCQEKFKADITRANGGNLVA